MRPISTIVTTQPIWQCLDKEFGVWAPAYIQHPSAAEAASADVWTMVWSGYDPNRFPPFQVKRGKSLEFKRNNRACKM